MSKENSPRVLQQQPQRDSDQQQQQSGSNDFQTKTYAANGQQQMGEGSYEGTRDYNQRTQEYLKKGNVETDAERAKPQSQEEARDLEKAEEEGRSHAKSQGDR